MADIHIPPAALEAGARAAMDDAGWHWDSADEARRDIWRRTASAAIAAALAAWPNITRELFVMAPDRKIYPSIVLPLPTETSDDQ